MVAVVVGVVLALLLRRRLNDQQVASPEASQQDWVPAVVDSPRLESATRDELYQEAKRLGIQGRSRMTKEQLRTALLRHEPE